MLSVVRSASRAQCTKRTCGRVNCSNRRSGGKRRRAGENIDIPKQTNKHYPRVGFLEAHGSFPTETSGTNTQGSPPLPCGRRSLAANVLLFEKHASEIDIHKKCELLHKGSFFFASTSPLQHKFRRKKKTPGWAVSMDQSNDPIHYLHETSTPSSSFVMLARLGVPLNTRRMCSTLNSVGATVNCRYPTHAMMWLIGR